jgi:hypothetical protein
MPSDRTRGNKYAAYEGHVQEFTKQNKLRNLAANYRGELNSFKLYISRDRPLIDDLDAILGYLRRRNVFCYDSRNNPASIIDYPDLHVNEANASLVTQYAWDSRSYPGNVFFAKAFDQSGDPAAACASYITAFQNPKINTKAFAPETMNILTIS